MDVPEQRFTELECENLFLLLFPSRFSGIDVVVEIAPKG
jgi:hypothetical protein